MSDDRTISERLASYGITHDGGGGHGRCLYWRGKSLGSAHAGQAVTLIEMLDHFTAPTPEEQHSKKEGAK